jgi:hypothetical protein
MYSRDLMMMCGAGGGGGRGGASGLGGDGGRGGGAIVIECAGSLNFSADIDVSGLDGGDGIVNGGAGGGGGNPILILEW